jgi:hypothetical protein
MWVPEESHSFLYYPFHDSTYSVSAFAIFIAQDENKKMEVEIHVFFILRIFHKMWIGNFNEFSKVTVSKTMNLVRQKGRWSLPHTDKFISYYFTYQTKRITLPHTCSSYQM